MYSVSKDFDEVDPLVSCLALCDTTFTVCYIQTGVETCSSQITWMRDTSHYDVAFMAFWGRQLGKQQMWPKFPKTNVGPFFLANTWWSKQGVI